MSAISSLCRTCMANVVNTTEEDVYSCNIFETEGLAEKLMLCSNIEIQPYDEYPPYVCNTCCINILDFCDFQEMCRESLEKFNKILDKQTKTGDNASVMVSRDRLTNTIDIESESNYEIILGDHSNDKQKDTEEDIIEIKSDPDSDEEADNGRLTGTKDCVIVEEINIARRETMEKIINCEHDYGQSCEAAVSRRLVGGSDGSEDEQGDNCGKVTDFEDDRGLGYNNMFKIICSVDETRFTLNPVSTELNLNKLEDVYPDDDGESNDGSSKTENECVSIDEDIDLIENLHVIEESLSEIHVTASEASVKTISITLPCNATAVTNIPNLPMENTFSDKIYVENDKSQLFRDFSDQREANKTQLENVDFENEEERIFEELSEGKEDKKAKSENGDCENEEECIFEDLSEDKEGDKKNHKHVSEDEANQGLQLFRCARENCTRFFNHLIDLRHHLRDHDGIPRHIYKCLVNNCGLKYTTKDGIQLHLQKHHNRGPALPARKYVCETCGKVYQHAHGLRVHQYIHVDESLWPFKCDIEGCSKKFRSNSNYKIHKNRHYGIKPYACTFCEKRFCADTNLQAHLNFHTLEKKWICSFCPKVCYTAGSLRLHIRTKHENNPDAKNFPCRFCKKILSTYTVRKCHERRHTGERPFVCEECGRGFKRAYDLRMHKQTHMSRGTPKMRTTVKNFDCSVCNKTLANATNLKRHEMKHTEGKQFECDICGVKFSYRRNLHRHQQQNLCRKSKTTKDKHPAEESSIEVSIIDKNVHINVEDNKKR